MKKKLIAGSMALVLGAISMPASALEVTIVNMDFGGIVPSSGTLVSTGGIASGLISGGSGNYDYFATASAVFDTTGGHNWSDVGGVDYNGTNYADANNDDVWINTFNYDFTLVEGQFAFGLSFDWSTNYDIPTLVIFDCAVSPVGSACIGTALPMAAGPFPGQSPIWNGYVDYSTAAFDSSAPTSVYENVTGTIYTAAASAGTTDIPTYSLSGTDAGLFTISNASGSEGELSFNSVPNHAIPDDADGGNDYDFTITATFSAATGPNAEVIDAPLPVDQNLSITVTDVNEFPLVFSSGTSISVSENQLATGYTAVATSANSSNVISYSIAGTGADDALFIIDANTGELSFASAPDFEAAGSATNDNAYVVDIVATGSVSPISSTTQTVTVNVTDVVVETFQIISSASVSVVENTTYAYTLQAIESSGPVTFNLLTSADSSAFNFDTVTGVLTFKVAPDYDSGQTSYSVSFTATDNEGTTAAYPVTITIIDANDQAPVFDSPNTVSMYENETLTGYTATTTDTDTAGSAVVYAIVRGADSTWFNIDASSGVLTFRVAPDYETPASSANSNAYVVNISAYDGANTTIQTVTVTVEDAFGPPVITPPSECPVALNEGDAYLSPLASATDAEDGDITGEILIVDPVDTSVPGDYLITYNVVNSEQIAAQEVTCAVSVNALPRVIINGAEVINLIIGDAYIEAGATATDAEDGVLTVMTTGSDAVDTSAVGIYEITYSATDSDAAAGSAIRRVAVRNTVSGPAVKVINMDFGVHGIAPASGTLVNAGGIVTGSFISPNWNDFDFIVTADSAFDMAGNHNWSATGGLDYMGTNYADPNNDDVWINTFSYDFALVDGQFAVALSMDWSTNYDIPVLAIFDCAVSPVGTACTGTALPMTAGPFPGQVLSWNGYVVYSTAAFDSTALTNVDEYVTGTIYTAAASAGTSDIPVYSLSGTDAGLFTISNASGTEGELSFNNVPIHANPADADGGNDYDLTITAAFPAATGPNAEVINAVSVDQVLSINVLAANGALPVFSQDSNFTVLNVDGTNANGGANNVVVSWNGITTTNIADTNFSNMTIASDTPFNDMNWSIHHVRMFGPGTYSFDTSCTVVELDAGTVSCNGGPILTMTVAAGQIGAHMLFDWSGSVNADVVNVYDINSVFTTDPVGSLWTAGDYGPYPWSGAPALETIWHLASTDNDGDGIAGIPMVDGLLIGSSINFNLVGADSNFTMLNDLGENTSGTNDVVAQWNGSTTTVTSDTNFNNLTISSDTPYDLNVWAVHHARMFGPGTYSFDTSCTVAQIETGVTSCSGGPMLTMTVALGQVGAHMLFDLGDSFNVDVVNVYDVNAAFTTNAPATLWTGSNYASYPWSGVPNVETVWRLVSTDNDGDGIAGVKMIDGNLVGWNVNFNLFSNAAVSILDTDNDGITDNQDNCSSTFNPNQNDSGGVDSNYPDGIGDACQCGDISGDGKITNTDAVLIKRHLLGLPSKFEADFCDVNGDGQCTNTDAVLIRRSILGLPPGLTQTCTAAGY